MAGFVAANDVIVVTVDGYVAGTIPASMAARPGTSASMAAAGFRTVFQDWLHT
jgi:hypothetical protein